jgi:hypothetical protein
MSEESKFRFMNFSILGILLESAFIIYYRVYDRGAV